MHECVEEKQQTLRLMTLSRIVPYLQASSRNYQSQPDQSNPTLLRKTNREVQKITLQLKIQSNV